MRIAIVHDWLNQKVGGAENVFFELADMYQNADLYTLVYDKSKFKPYLKDRKIITSRLQKFPKYMKKRPYLLLPFIKKSVNSLNFDNYDIVISSSTAWVKNIKINQPTMHICYCHSPARMLWDSWPNYLQKFKLGGIGKFIVLHITSKLRLWDYYQSQKPIKLIANSEYISRRIKKYYSKSSLVVYPPVRLPEITKATKKSDYYVVLSVLAKYKNIDLAIKAFANSKRRLVIIGDGAEYSKLKEMARPYKNIEFLGRVDDNTKYNVLKKAKGFVFCNIEDFGITLAESIACGTAVIAPRGGGAEEIIRENDTGIFYEEISADSLRNAVEHFEEIFKDNYVLENNYISKKFANIIFRDKIKSIVNESK